VLLDELTRTDETNSEDARNRSALARDLKGLTAHRDTGVRVKALEAYTRWGGDDARAVCLKFLESPNQDEREVAIRLLPHWRDSESARAIAAQIGRSTRETTAAIKSLQEIGGSLAEEALIPQLEVDDSKVRVLVMDLLASSEIGGPAALAKLRQLADNPPPNSKAFEDPGTRQEAGRKANLLAERLKK
jgi:HEAT repeat protein